MPTSTRCGEERNRSTPVLIKTGSPASTSRTWSRRDTHPDELRRHRVPGRHPVSLRPAATKAPPTDDPHRLAWVDWPVIPRGDPDLPHRQVNRARHPVRWAGVRVSAATVGTDLP